MPIEAKLRLSTLRAFLGRIHLEMRLVKVKWEDDKIILSVLVSGELSKRARMDVSEAAAEVIADFPEAVRIIEHITIVTDAIEWEDIHSEGWVFRRAE